MSFVFAFLCGLAAAALHLHLLRRALERGLEAGSAAALAWSAPLRLLTTAGLIAAPVLWAGGAGALLALAGFALCSHTLRWRALPAEEPA